MSIIIIKIPEQEIKVKIIEDVTSDKIKNNMRANNMQTLLSGLGMIDYIHITKQIECEVIIPPKQAFTREEIIEPIIQKLNDSYQGVSFHQMKKMNFIKLAESLGIDFDTEIKPKLK